MRLGNLPQEKRPRRYRQLFALSLIAALVPIVWATVRALLNDWVPIGDASFFSIRSYDVFTEHRPLLGTWTSASQSVGIDINNPGPLFFDILAVPVRVFGTIDGLAIGTMLLNCAAVVGVAIIAYRRGGAVLGTAAMLVIALMCWSMGSELMFDPWQPHALLLPFLFFLMTVWALSCGELVMLPWAVGVGSMVVQTHLSYAYLVPVLIGWGLLGYFLTSRRWKRSAERSDAVWAGRRASIIRTAIITGVVLVLCWIQPVWEEFTSPGDGNITRLVNSLSSSEAAVIGLNRGIRLVSTVLALPPYWLRPAFNDAFVAAGGGPESGPGGIGVAHLPSLATALLGLFTFALVMAVAYWDAVRRRDTEIRRAITTAAIAIVLGCYTAGQIPRTVFGVAPHQFRWIWPVAAFTTFAVLAIIARRIIQNSRDRRTPGVVWTFALITLGFALLNLPTYAVHAGPTADRFAGPVVRDLDRQMDGLEQYGTLLYDFHGVFFAEPYSTAIMAELQRRGIPFVVDVEGLVRQLGETRRYDGNAQWRIFYRYGEDTRVTPRGARRVAYHQGLGPNEQAQFDRLRDQIAGELRAGRLELTPSGRRAIARGQYATLGRALSGDATADDVFRSRQFVSAYRDGVLDLKPPWTARFKRYVELQRRFDLEEVAIYVAPIE
jgi:hypothetical protein